jgi:hypothetical protein
VNAAAACDPRGIAEGRGELGGAAAGSPPRVDGGGVRFLPFKNFRSITSKKILSFKNIK